MLISTKKACALLIVLVVLLGIVGSMDYQDAMQSEHPEVDGVVKLKCLPITSNGMRKHSIMLQGDAAFLRPAEHYIVEIDPETMQTVFQCVVIGD
jgi:hypothetical protein